MNTNQKKSEEKSLKKISEKQTISPIGNS